MPERDPRAAFAWAESVMGGKIVHREQMSRWRPTWFLDIEQKDSTVQKCYLRGFRAAGVTEDEAASRERLRMEAGFIKALQNTKVKVPTYYGYEPGGGWILMENVKGDFAITGVESKELQQQIFRQYIENVAVMHNLDYTLLDLPDNLPVNEDYESAVHMMVNWAQQSFDASPHKEDPEPLFTLAQWWLAAHPPRPANKYSLTSGDIGPDQFIFDNGELKSLFDLEYCYVGDAMQDIGLMRLRNMCYPIPDLPGHIRHWAQQTNRELDKQSLSYWTVVGMTVSPMLFYPQKIRPNPVMLADVNLINSCTPIHRRGLLEALAEFYDFELEIPARPAERSHRLHRFGRLLTEELRQYHVPRAIEPDRYMLNCTLAVAEAAELSASIGPELVRQNISDLEILLGRAFSSEHNALAALEEQVERDPEHQLEDTIRVLHRIECRMEFLQAPIQDFSGFSSLVPLQRM